MTDLILNEKLTSLNVGDVVVSTTQCDRLFYKVVKVNKVKLDECPTVSLQVIRWNRLTDGWVYGHIYKNTTLHCLRKV